MQIKTFALCVLFLCFLSFPALSQSKEKIDLQLNNVTLKEFFSSIEKKLGYSFMYSNVDIDDSKRVSIDEKNADINSLLSKVFKTNLSVTKSR